MKIDSTDKGLYIFKYVTERDAEEDDANFVTITALNLKHALDEFIKEVNEALENNNIDFFSLVDVKEFKLND